MNAKNIINAFNNEVKSFNTAIRFVYETSKVTTEKIAAAPAKDDMSDDAKALRKAIKASEKKNALIADCIAIVDAFNITANDMKGKAIQSLRNRIIEKTPMIDVNGVAVKMAKLPSYLKNEVNGYNEVFTIVPASWIETIIAAAENVDGIQKSEYNVTVAPVVAEGEIVEGASGDIVNAKGEKIETSNIFEIWNKEAKINNIANAVGNAAKAASKAEQKAK